MTEPDALVARHDRDAGLEHVLAVHLEVGVAAAEQARKEPPQTLIGFLESLLESRARFAVDLADRVLERLERFGQVGELRVEILLAFRLFLELVDGGQVDSAEPLEPALELLERVVPHDFRRVRRQAERDLVEQEARRRELLAHGFRADLRFARGEAHVVGQLAKLVYDLLVLFTLLLGITQLRIDFVHG